MLRVEFHCHTRFSKDCLVDPARLVECCRRKGLDRVVITDHNSIDGALEAKRLDPGLVIIGEEIMTSGGEILAAFVTSAIPSGLSPEETISRLRQQDAFVSVSHPFDQYRRGSWREDQLTRILPLIDAIEVFNSRCMHPAQNEWARRYAASHGLAGTVGSDAHTCWELGRATLLLERIESPGALRASLPSAHLEARWSPPWIHLTSRYAVLIKRMQRQLDMHPGA